MRTNSGEELAELTAARRRFVVPALVVFVLWFGGFIVLVGYAHSFMGTRIVGAITWAYVLALSIVVLTWATTFLYLRWADSTLQPLADRAAEEAERR